MKRLKNPAIGIAQRLLVVSLLITHTIVLNAQKTSDMETQIKTGYAPVNGINMYYEIYGEGPITLVLIHGGGSTIQSSFGKLLPILAADNKILAVELQAHGRTSDRNEPESFAQDADDVAALLDYLKINKANILGFSNGASTTLQIAIRHPEIVNKIIPISGAYRRDGFIPGFFDGFEHATLAHMPEHLKADFLQVTPDSNKLQVMFEKDVQRMKTFKDWPDDDLRSIKATALFMSSHLDVVTPAHTVQMAILVPGAQLAILPGTHGVMIGEVGSGPKGEKMAAVTAMLIEEFLKE